MGAGKTALVAGLAVILFLTIVTGIMCGVGSFVVNFVFRNILEKRVSEQVTLEEGNVPYELLRQPSIPVYKSYYFFNLTNPENFQDGLAKPVLKEIGPYTYRERRQKYFVENWNNTVLSYTQSVLYHYVSSSSGEGLSQKDVICTINIPVMAGVYNAEGNAFVTDVFKTLLNWTSSELCTCQTVSGLLWGYTDYLMEELYDLGFISTKVAYMQVNGSVNDSQPSSIYTGVHDITKLAEYIQWDGHTQYLDTWPGGDQANAIRGTEGAFFRPNLRQGEDLEMFVGDLQRSFDLVSTGSSYHLGFRTLRYEFSPSTFKGAFSERDNSMWGSWCPDGLFYMGAIRDPTLPLYISKPHFLEGAESLLEGVDGLDPCSNRHDSHIDVEPHVGVNLDFSIKLQLNVRVNSSSDYSFLGNLQGMDESGSLFVPVFYIDQYAEFTEEVREYLDDSGLNDVIKIESIISQVVNVLVGVSIGSGVASAVLFLSLLCLLITSLRKRKREERKPLLDTPSNLPSPVVRKHYSNKLTQ